MAADPATGGYWEAASDGGVFSFDAPFYGSESGSALSAALPDPVRAIAAAPNGGGYLLLATDPAVEPGVPGRSAYDLARQQWVDDYALACFEESLPLFQAAQYLLIGEQDGGTAAAYGAAAGELVQLAQTVPETTVTPTEAAMARRDDAALSAFFGVSGGYCG